MANSDHSEHAGYRHRNQERWRTHVLAQQRSSLTQREYCQTHDLSYSSFTRWRRLLPGHGTPQHATSDDTGFVPVLIKPTPAPEAFEQIDSALSLVLSSGIRIEGVTAASLSTALALAAAL